MEDYKPKSHRSQESNPDSTPEKRVEKVITGVAKTKKKSDFHKFTDIFVSEDVSNVKNYIFLDVLVPAIKKAISDIVTNGIDMLLYGESGRGKKSSGGSKISYRSYYDKANDRGAYSGPRARSGFEYDDILFDNRGDAEGVLIQLEEIIDKYRSASVFDLYDSAGLTAPFTANKYGWTDLRNASVVRTRDGYILKLPKALPLD